MRRPFGVVCIAIATLTACATSHSAHSDRSDAPLTLASRQALDFYAVEPGEVPGLRGSIIRHEPIPIVIGSTFGQDFPAASMYRVLYRTTGPKNEPVAASAVLIIPEIPAPPDGRPVVAWAHPTSGILPPCAPSLSRDVARTIPGLSELVTGGVVVVAPDYPGLGTPGMHPYLVKASAGHAVLDAVRAARDFPGAQAGKRFIAWGHSQGGHASLSSAELAKSYAPELNVLGVALAAPATEFTTLLHTPPGKPMHDPNIAGLMLSWSRVYGIPIESLVRLSDVRHVEELAAHCSFPVFVGTWQPPEERAPRVSFTLTQDLATTSPWRERLEQNSPKVLPGVPVFLARGGEDRLVPSKVLGAYQAELCAAGSPVKSVALPGVVHDFVARDAAPQAVDWMLARFAGSAPPNDCVNR